MVDQNNFINSYIDITINSLTEYVKANLQLQTQVKVANDTIQQKDGIIAALNEQLSKNAIAEDWKAKYEASEQNYSAAMGKLSHMDTLLKQLSDMKKVINDQNEIINKNSAPKVINTKISKKAEEPVKKQPKETDDF